MKPKFNHRQPERAKSGNTPRCLENLRSWRIAQSLTETWTDANIWENVWME